MNEALRKYLTERAEAQKAEIDGRLARLLKSLDSLPDELPVESPVVFEFSDITLLEWPKVKGWEVVAATAASTAKAERIDEPAKTTVLVDAPDGKVAIAFAE